MRCLRNKVRHIAVAVLGLLAVTASAYANGEHQALKNEMPIPGKDASESSGLGRGQAVYNGTCIACHGSDGTGSLPGVPDLTGKTGLLSQDDAVLLGRMADGFQSPGSSMAMPPKGGNPALTDVDLSAVLKYMRHEFQQDPQTRGNTQ
jgi:mono/diheme cytochrome c family protein